MRKNETVRREQGEKRDYVLIMPPKGSFLPGLSIAGLRDGRNPLPRVRFC
ncbi:MAG TPA: hypothetical protein PLD82_03405 [Spirochaetota bacterium]|nr:hypothetical protein [Spirochaetota bacterium]